MPELLAPLDQQPCPDQETLAREHRTLQRRKLIGRQPGNPATDDAPCHFGLLDWHDARLVEDRLELDARPDGGGEEADDGLGRADLDVAQRLGPVHVHLDLRRVVRRVLRRPAEDRVCVEVPHHDCDDLFARLPVALRFCFEEVLRPRHHRGHGDVVVLQCLLRGLEEIPLDGYCVGEVGF